MRSLARHSLTVVRRMAEMPSVSAVRDLKTIVETGGKVAWISTNVPLERTIARWRQIVSISRAASGASVNRDMLAMASNVLVSVCPANRYV